MNCRVPNVTSDASRSLEQPPATIAIHRSALEACEHVLDCSVEAAHDSEVRLRQFADSLQQATFLVSADQQRLLFVSAAYEDVWGRSRQSLHGAPMSWIDGVHPDDRASAQQAFSACDSDRPQPTRYRVIRPDGQVRWVASRTMPIRDRAGGEICRFACIAEDITDRVALEEALLEREARLQRAQKLARLAHVITRPGGDFECWSETLPSLVGLTECTLPRSTRDWLDLIHPEDRTLFRRRALEAGATGGRTDVDYRILRPDGTCLHIRQVMEPMTWGAEGSDLWFCTLQDATEERHALERLRESELRFRQLAENIEDVFWVSKRDLSGVLYVSPAYERIWGRSCEDLYRNPVAWIEAIHAEDRPGIEAEIHAARQAQRGFDVEYRIVRPDGAVRWISDRGFPVRDDGGANDRIAGVAADITERKLAEQKIMRLNRVHAMLSGVNALIVRARNRSELYRDACRIAVEAGAYRMVWIGEIDGATQEGRVVAWHGNGDAIVPRLRINARDGTLDSQLLASRAVREGRPTICNDIATDPCAAPVRELMLSNGHRSSACLPLATNGKSAAVLALLSGEADTFTDEEMKLLRELAGNIEFALDRLQKTERLDYLAYYDELTGLANRSLLAERLSQHIATAAGGHKAALVLIDLNRFKNVNDALGRSAGDEVLRQVARRLCEGVPAQQHLARIDGDRFALIVPEVTAETNLARSVTELVAHCFGPSFEVDGNVLRMVARIGVALYPDDGQDVATLCGHAEAALARGKSADERVTFYSPRMTEAMSERLALERKLHSAIERDELSLLYQPKVDVDTRRVTGVEALMRWTSEGLGVVSPAKFIPILEETGLILEAGAWALRRAAEDRRRWAARFGGAPRVAVNVSALQLQQADFVATIEAALQHDADPQGIDLEITESLLMANVEVNIGKLRAIRSLGVQLAIDDFGTGYSSLAYLAKLPVHTLKIDRSFISTMLDDPDQMTLVSTMISLAHSLRMEVVAEGVEQQEQAKLLRLLRCDQMQGYLVSRPIPFEEVGALLSDARWNFDLAEGRTTRHGKQA